MLVSVQCNGGLLPDILPTLCDYVGEPFEYLTALFSIFNCEKNRRKCYPSPAYWQIELSGKSCVETTSSRTRFDL